MSKLSLNFFFAVLLLHLPVFAQSRAYDYDFWQTLPGTSLDLSAMGLGVISLQGVTISARVCNSALIIQRAETTPQGNEPAPIVIFAIFLKSAGPVTYQGHPADLYITLNNSGGYVSTSVLPQPDSLAPSSGSMKARPDGTFDLNVTINGDLVFVKAGTSVTNSANYLGHQPAPSATLKWLGIHRSSSPPPLYPQNTYFPSGNSYPTGVSDSQGAAMCLNIAPAQCNAQ